MCDGDGHRGQKQADNQHDPHKGVKQMNRLPVDCMGRRRTMDGVGKHVEDSHEHCGEDSFELQRDFPYLAIQHFDVEDKCCDDMMEADGYY